MSSARPSYEPYTHEADPADPGRGIFEDYVLTSVTPNDIDASGEPAGWTLMSGGTGVFMPNVRPGVPAPKVGDTLRIWGQLGRPIHGQALNGMVIWYRNAADQAAWWRRHMENLDAQQRREFYLGRPLLDATFAALKDQRLRDRIERFRATDPDFRIRSESYELFCCEQAERLLEAVGDEAGVRAFAAGLRDEPIPGWKTNDHSGGTYHGSIRIALALATGGAV